MVAAMRKHWIHSTYNCWLPQYHVFLLYLLPFLFVFFFPEIHKDWQTSALDSSCPPSPLSTKVLSLRHSCSQAPHMAQWDPWSTERKGLDPNTGRCAEWEVLMQASSPFYPRILMFSGFMCSSCQGPRQSLVGTGIESLNLEPNGSRCWELRCKPWHSSKAGRLG